MSEDLNDKLQKGTLPTDLQRDATPMNERARQAAERLPPRIHTVKELLADAAQRATQRDKLADACTTGHYELDAVTGGFVPGFIWVFGADTSWGKSSFAISVADENIQRGKRVLIVSAEDPASLYGDRLLARRARVSADRLRKGRLQPEELQRVHDVRRKGEDVPVYCHAENRPIERLRKELEILIKLEGIHMVVFDYLQEFRSSGKHQDERTRFKHTSQVMRDLLRSNNKGGAILSQLTISGDTKIPSKHNIRESRDVSNAAEVICLGFTPDADVKGPSPGNNEQGRPLEPEILFKAGKRYVLVDKNKNGPRKKIVMDWDDNSACFNAVKDPEQERLDREAAQYEHLVADFQDGL